MLSSPGVENPYPAGPEFLPPAPRAVRWNSRARWMRTAAWGGLLFLPNVILAWGWQSGEDLRDLKDHGQSTFGRVTEMRETSSRNGRTYHVGYAYEVNGANYGGRTTVSAAEYAGLARGHTYPVTYLPERPGISCAGRPGPQLQQHNTLTLVFAFATAAGFGVWVGCLTFALRRERDLVREGEPAVGRITERGTTRGKNTTYYWARHEFPGPADEAVENWHYVPRGIWEELHPGRRVTLLYDPANSRRHLPLYAFKYAYIPEEESEEAAAPDLGEA